MRLILSLALVACAALPAMAQSGRQGRLFRGSSYYPQGRVSYSYAPIGYAQPGTIVSSSPVVTDSSTPFATQPGTIVYQSSSFPSSQPIIYSQPIYSQPIYSTPAPSYTPYQPRVIYSQPVYTQPQPQVIYSQPIYPSPQRVWSSQPIVRTYETPGWSPVPGTTYYPPSEGQVIPGGQPFPGTVVINPSTTPQPNWNYVPQVDYGQRLMTPQPTRGGFAGRRIIYR